MIAKLALAVAVVAVVAAGRLACYEIVPITIIERSGYAYRLDRWTGKMSVFVGTEQFAVDEDINRPRS